MSEKPSANTVFVSLLLAASASAKMNGGGELPKGTASPDPRFSTSDLQLKDPLVSFQGRRCVSHASPVPLDETLARETREAALCVLTAPASYFDTARSQRFLTDEYGTLLRPRVRLPQNRAVEFKRGNKEYRVSVHNEENGTARTDPGREGDFIYINVRPKDAPKNVRGNHIQDTGLTGRVSLGADRNRGGHEYAPCYDTPEWEELFKRDYCRDRFESIMGEDGMEYGMQLPNRPEIEVECMPETEAGWPEEYGKLKAHYAAKRAQYEKMYRTAVDDIRAHCRQKMQRAQLRPRQRK